ncbi:hypothetical protein G6F33_012335 [Rhizopus arrhizus]|nr:hypothetical protein G6F33_012335 [Rhizopus arrhizus]
MSFNLVSDLISTFLLSNNKQSLIDKFIDKINYVSTVCKSENDLHWKEMISFLSNEFDLNKIKNTSIFYKKFFPLIQNFLNQIFEIFTGRLVKYIAADDIAPTTGQLHKHIYLELVDFWDVKDTGKTFAVRDSLDNLISPNVGESSDYELKCKKLDKQYTAYKLISGKSKLTEVTREYPELLYWYNNLKEWQMFGIQTWFSGKSKSPQYWIVGPKDVGKTENIKILKNKGHRSYLMPKNKDWADWDDDNIDFVYSEETHADYPLTFLNQMLEGSEIKLEGMESYDYLFENEFENESSTDKSYIKYIKTFDNQVNVIPFQEITVDMFEKPTENKYFKNLHFEPTDIYSHPEPIYQDDIGETDNEPVYSDVNTDDLSVSDDSLFISEVDDKELLKTTKKQLRNINKRNKKKIKKLKLKEAAEAAVNNIFVDNYDPPDYDPNYNTSIDDMEPNPGYISDVDTNTIKDNAIVPDSDNNNAEHNIVYYDETVEQFGHPIDYTINCKDHIKIDKLRAQEKDWKEHNKKINDIRSGKVLKSKPKPKLDLFNKWLLNKNIIDNNNVLGDLN